MDFAYKVIAIALPFVMGALTAFIARRKGRNVAGWFVLGLIFQLFALPVVLLLPSQKQMLGEPVVSDSRVLAFLGKVFGGVFLGFMVIFAANGGAGGSSEMRAAAWTALVIYLAFFIPAVALWAKQAYKPNA